MDQAEVFRYVGEMYIQSKAEIQKLHNIIEEQRRQIEALQMLLEQHERERSLSL